MIYWHISMNKPYGNHKPEQPGLGKAMLDHTPSLIGLNWGPESNQARKFINSNQSPQKLKVGSIILVREASKPLALCRVISEVFPADAILKRKFHFDRLREVEILQNLDHLSESFTDYKKAFRGLSNSSRPNYKFIERLFSQYQKHSHLESLINLLKAKHQIILQGPPGTGKTYTAKNIAEQMIFNEVSDDKKVQAERLRGSDQFALVQFHPAYSYEDFVRGIVAKNEGGGITYETEDKVLLNIAARALENQRNAAKSPEILSREKWIDQQIQRFADKIAEELAESEYIKLNKSVGIVGVQEDAFRYEGQNGWKSSSRFRFEDLRKMYEREVTTQREVRHLTMISPLARDHAAYTWRIYEQFKKFLADDGAIYVPPPTAKEKERPYILLIDEINRANLPAVLGELIYALEYRGESVDGLYEKDGIKSIVLPKNLYLIGTMNTADRSVGHIDYAIRRRFAFKHLKPKDEVLTGTGAEAAAKSKFEKVASLFKGDNAKLNPDFQAEDVCLGHSYFIADTEEELRMKIQYEVVPILREYVRDGVLLEGATKTIDELVAVV